MVIGDPMLNTLQLQIRLKRWLKLIVRAYTQDKPYLNKNKVLAAEIWQCLTCL